MTSKGTVKFYNDERGFGFLIPEDKSGDVFFHVSVIAGGAKLREGDAVRYVLGQGRDGRPKATSVDIAE